MNFHRFSYFSIEVVYRRLGLQGLGKWLKVAGDDKASILEHSIDSRPMTEHKTMAEFGAFIGYTATRMARQAGQGQITVLRSFYQGWNVQNIQKIIRDFQKISRGFLRDCEKTIRDSENQSGF